MDPLAPLIDALHAQGRLRVWSLVITAFGDLVQHRGGEISTARLGQLLVRVGVEQGALRTALSRLGRDGWVTSTRQGRTSLYRLSPQGLDRFARATNLIYAAPRTTPVTQWAISLRLNASGVPEPLVHAADSDMPQADCRVIGRLDQMSDAYRAACFSPAHRLALTSLRRDLEAVPQGRSAPLVAAAARLLLIHRWRRIVLRFADLPRDLMPADSPLPDPRARVARAYAHLAPDAERWLDSAAEGLTAMPPASPAFNTRFGGAVQA